MHPILIKIGAFQIYTYGFLVALGFLTGIQVAKTEARRVGQDPDEIMNLCFYLVIAALIGSRIFYIAVNPSFFISQPLEMIKLWNGGLVFYGGFIGALIVLVVYIKKKRLPLWATLDILAPSLAAGQFVGRVGCFFAGCCYGKACELPWAVTFDHPHSLAPLHVPLHPTQLYHALGNLVIFIILWLLRRDKGADGRLFALYLLLYGAIRFVLEFLRGDFRGYFLWDVLSVSQAVGCLSVLIGLVIMIRLRKKG